MKQPNVGAVDVPLLKTQLPPQFLRFQPKGKKWVAWHATIQTHLDCKSYSQMSCFSQAHIEKWNPAWVK